MNIKWLVAFVSVLLCTCSCKKQESIYHTLSGTMHIPYYVSYQSDRSLDPEIEQTIINLKYSVCHNEPSIRSTADNILEFAGYCIPHVQENEILGKVPVVPADTLCRDEEFICDSLSRIFENKEIDNYVIEIGGMVIAKGTDSREKPWRIEPH